MRSQMTVQTQAVLRVMLGARLAKHYELEIAKAAGLKSGSLYPILARLERDGLAVSDWDHQANPQGAGRPRRRYYMLTPAGAAVAEQAPADTVKWLSLRRSTLGRPGWAGTP